MIELFKFDILGDSAPNRIHSLTKKKSKKEHKRHTMAGLPGVRESDHVRKSASMTIQTDLEDDRLRSRTMPGRINNDHGPKKSTSSNVKILKAPPSELGSNASINSRNGRASIAVTEEVQKYLRIKFQDKFEKLLRQR